jgi:hypothetical protein
MNEYDKIKRSLNGVTNHKDIDDLIATTTQHRDQLNEIIDLAMDKKAALANQQQAEKW